MGILSWLVVGLIAGFLASRVMRGGGYGLIGDIVVGVIGALIGGFLASTLLKMPNAVSGILDVVLHIMNRILDAVLRVMNCILDIVLRVMNGIVNLLCVVRHLSLQSIE
jgi:uncharacterized membrane protein YeaQ/YmgE (transglycosylase-associated protein family)